MNHDPDESIRLSPTTLSSTRWGLRTGRNRRDRRRIGAYLIRHSRRGMSDYLQEVETPPDQIGAKWCAYQDEDEDDFFFDPHGQEIPPSTDGNHHARWRHLIDIANDECLDDIRRRDKTERVGEILHAIEKSPHRVLSLILDILIERAENTETFDGDVIGLGMGAHEGLSLFRVVLCSLRANALDQMDKIYPFDPKRDKEKISACWQGFNDFVREVHGILRGAKIILPRPPNRRIQFLTIETWVKQDGLTKREQTLRAWRVRVVKLAAALKDRGDLNLHEEVGLTNSLSHAESGLRLSGYDADVVRKFLRGHPDADVRNLLEEFEAKWTEVNSIRVTDTSPEKVTPTSAEAAIAAVMALLGPAPRAQRG